MFATESTDILYARADELGLKPSKLNEYGLLEITTYSGAKQYIFHSKTALNSQLSSYLVSNKHTTRQILEQHNLPNIPYCLPKTQRELRDFFIKHQPVVVKPTYGHGSHGVRMIDDVAQLDNLDITTIVAEKFIEGQEERYLVLNGQVIAVHQKLYDGPINSAETLRRVSLKSDTWHSERTRMAVQIAQVFRLRFAAVDFIVMSDGTFVVLEVNSAPGIAWFHTPTSGPSVDVAGMLLLAMAKEAEVANL